MAQWLVLSDVFWTNSRGRATPASTAMVASAWRMSSPLRCSKPWTSFRVRHSSAAVLAGVSGASLTALQAEIEQVVVDVLPGDLTHSDLDIRAQPDARIDSRGAFVFVEAKRLRRSSFQPEQLAKELLLVAEHAQGRRAALLLVLGAPPPVTVQGHGSMSIEDAVRLGQELISARHGRPVVTPNPSDMVAWTTWANIAAQVEEAMQTYDTPDRSTYNAIARVANTVDDASAHTHRRPCSDRTPACQDMRLIAACRPTGPGQESHIRWCGDLVLYVPPVRAASVEATHKVRGRGSHVGRRRHRNRPARRTPVARAPRHGRMVASQPS